LRRAKVKGCVVFNRPRATWNFLWREGKKRKSVKLGTLADLPTKVEALEKAEAFKRDYRLQQERAVVTVRKMVEWYRAEKMPRRWDTRRMYESWLRNYILPKWGARPLADVQARPVELWLEGLPLAPKSRVHIRSVLCRLWEFAMWRQLVSVQRNPMSLVTVKGATKRKKKPRSLTVDEFQRFISHLEEPFRTIALLCVSFGLRISEALALKWSDVDWLNSRLKVERSIVSQIVDAVKTPESEQTLHVASEILDVLKLWKQATQFSADEDWIFASPVHLGRLPWSYDAVWHAYQRAAKAAGLGGLGTHSLRHTYRSWLDAVGTALAVQQKLMRHADIRTTMNIYGDVVTDEMRKAHEKVAGLAVGKPN
jgi:integrase